MITALSFSFYSLLILMLDHRILQGHAIDATQYARTPNTMNLVSFPETSEVPGGKCLDGTQAGFYVRSGSNPKLFVIFLKGGGACYDQESCDTRAETKGGSSKDWPASIEGANILSGICLENPDFCDATAVYVDYCTGDFHLGTRIESSEESFGYEFHGRYNFMRTIDMLEADYGLGDADAVLFSGASAGAFGALLTVDWLAERLPNAVVKASLLAGWFTPNSLPDDLPDPRLPPSNYDWFKNNTNGNDVLDDVNSGNSTDPWLIEYAMDEQCVIENADFPPFCLLVHVAYKYIKSSIYFVQPLFDGVHIIGGAPQGTDIPTNETDIFKDYVAMWGEAMYLSMDQVINATAVNTKPHPDGLFATSCIAHAVPKFVLIDGYNWNDLMNDWFFQKNDLEEQHQLVESCPNGDNSLPCNEYWNECLLPESIIYPCSRYSKKKPCKEDSECVWYKENSDDTGSCISCSTLESKTTCQDVGCIWDDFGQMCYAPTSSPTPSPTAAPTPMPTLSDCNEGDIEVVVEVFTDRSAGETSWDIQDASGTVVASGGGPGKYTDEYTLYSHKLCLDKTEACDGVDYSFTIYDSSGNGICCELDEGFYNVYVEGELNASGGAFGSSETTPICKCFENVQRKKCQAIFGCAWTKDSEGVGSCMATADNCSKQNKRKFCLETDGCFWKSNGDGTGRCKLCSSITKQSACFSKETCIWEDNMCK